MHTVFLSQGVLPASVFSRQKCAVSFTVLSFPIQLLPPRPGMHALPFPFVQPPPLSGLPRYQFCRNRSMFSSLLLSRTPCFQTSIAMLTSGYGLPLAILMVPPSSFFSFFNFFTGRPRPLSSVLWLPSPSAIGDVRLLSSQNAATVTNF